MGVYILRKTFRFEASHQLPHHDGKCARLHGHSWAMTVELRGEALGPTRLVDEVRIMNAEPCAIMPNYNPKAGMLLDFADVSKAVAPFLDKFLDHWHLNETTKIENPTSEALCKWMFVGLEPTLPLLYAVEIEETCTSSARYER